MDRAAEIEREDLDDRERAEADWAAEQADVKRDLANEARELDIDRVHRGAERAAIIRFHQEAIRYHEKRLDALLAPDADTGAADPR